MNKFSKYVGRPSRRVLHCHIVVGKFSRANSLLGGTAAGSRQGVASEPFLRAPDTL
jgi:hypothetical protein